MSVEVSFPTLSQKQVMLSSLAKTSIQMLHKKGHRPNAYQDSYATWYHLGNGLIVVVEEEIQLKQVKFLASSALHLHMDL